MAWISFMLLTSITGIVLSVDERYSVTIVTNPSQGPFRIGPQYQFSCVVEPTPPEPVTYQWNYVEEAQSSSTSSVQSISRSYNYYSSINYCYYLCAVSINQTLIGSASKIIEVHGWVYSQEPVVRSFRHGEHIVLNVNISDDYRGFIGSLAWYHNETKLLTGNKYRIINNTTTLSVSDMTESDAGVYEVKIDSISYGINEDPNCDSIVLPLLESLAAHTPVKFTVQERYLPEYDPHSIVSTYYVTESNNFRIELRKDVQLSTIVVSIYSDWFRNGSNLYIDGHMYNSTATSQELSLRITSNNIGDIIGDYVGVLWFRTRDLDAVRNLCSGYYNFFHDFYYSIYSSLPLRASYWSVKVYRPPSSVLLHFREPVLMELESTAVECTAVDGEPPEAINLTLWWNEELIARVNGNHLSYSTTPHPYGTYRCSAGDVHNTSILFERANFQLLLDDNSLLCQQNQQADSLRAVLSEVFSSLCQSCDDVYPSNIVDVQLNCSASERLGYLTAGLVYSSSDGRITASTLSSMLTAWLLSEDNPSILVDGTTVGLSKQCPTQLNAVTQSGCIQLLTSDSEAPAAESTSLVGHMAGLFAAGLATGVLITVFVIALIFIVRKLKVRAAAPQQPAADKSADVIAMGTNQAYESVDTRYQAGRLGRIPAQEDEVIYELPTV